MVACSRKGAASFRNSLPATLVIDKHLFLIINLYLYCSFNLVVGRKILLDIMSD
jgi:hypothetical protein